jgi:hypothetical protein
VCGRPGLWRAFSLVADENRRYDIGTLWEVGLMQGETKERWLELCAQAADEKDSVKLLALVQEISRLLQEKEERLKAQRRINSSNLGRT